MKAFACPQCGASLESDATYNATVECPYCHSTVIVPPELRPPPPPPRPPVPPPDYNNYEPAVVPKPTFSFVRALAFIVVFIAFFLFVIIALVKPSRDKTSSYTPYRPTVSPSATPTPYVFSFGGEGTGPGLFKDVQDVAVDGEGNIFVADDTLRVQKFNSRGEYLSQWTLPSSTRYVSKIHGGPDRLLADRKGQVYVVIGGVLLTYDEARADWVSAANGTDYIYDAVLKANGGMVIVSGSGGSDDLVVFDGKGNAIRRVNKFISTQLDKQIPVDALKVAVDGVGNIFSIYALGSVNGEHYYDDEDLAVFRFDANGKYINRFGGGGNEAGEFASPTAIAVDSKSRVYVCDLTKGLNAFTAEGRYLRTVQTPYWVQGMVFDSEGNLFVVGNNRVTRLDFRN